MVAVLSLSACSEDEDTSNNETTGSNDSSSTSDGDSPTNTDRPEPTMGLSTQSLVHDNLTREYDLYVPSSYDGSEAFPVLLNFHGGTGTSQEQMYIADMRNLADEEGFLLIYPQAARESGETNWNTLRSAELSKLEADDFGFIEALIDSLAANYVVDTSRVYATGYSNGAGFSYALACQLSDKIAAVAPVSGLMPIDASEYPCSPTHPTSIMIFNGTQDYERPYSGIDGYLLSVDEAVSFWTGYNNLNDTAEMTTINDGGLTIERYAYSGGDGGVELRLYRVVGGGHYWFEFPDDGMAHNQMIWNFLSRFNLDGQL